jgi:tRNA G46 methylase TrmB
MARGYPASNFLGVERQRERVEKARKKIAWLGLGNVAVVRGDGLQFLDVCPTHAPIVCMFFFPTRGPSDVTRFGGWLVRTF